MELDTVDKKILTTLQKNSRLSYRQIAKEVKVSVATAMHRVKALEQKGIIKHYTAELDTEKLGYDVQVIIEVQISKGKLLHVEHKIARHPNVVAVYDCTGDFDVILIARFKSRRLMDDFLKTIQTYDFVERTNTKLILNIIKEGSIHL